MRIRMFLLVMLIAIILSGCDDTTTPEKDEDFILAVMVLDTGGQPKANMTVARLNSLEGIDPVMSNQASPAIPDTLIFSYPNPFYGHTTIQFSAEDFRKALLEIVDWRGRHVRTIRNGMVPAGFFSDVWDGEDSGGVPVINGVYTQHLTLTDTLDVPEYEFSGLVACTVFDQRDPYRHEGMGSTDATGFFSTRDLDLFPSLQGHGLQDAYNETADQIGTFSFSDTVTIRVSTPPPSGDGWIYHMSRDIVLVDGPNYLEFYFVPDDSTVIVTTAR